MTEYTIPKSEESEDLAPAPPENRAVVPVYVVPENWKQVAAKQSGMPSYHLPPEWVEAPDAPLSVGTYKVAKDGQEALVTITPLGELTEEGLPPNINRWRGQASLPPVAPEETLSAVSTLIVDGAKARYIKIVPDEVNPEVKAMLVACIDNAGATWYFKLFGNAPLILEEEVRFQTFAQSVRFSPN